MKSSSASTLPSTSISSSGSASAPTGSRRAQRQAFHHHSAAAALPQTNHAEFMARLHLAQEQRDSETAENARYAKQTEADASARRIQLSQAADRDAKRDSKVRSSCVTLEHVVWYTWACCVVRLHALFLTHQQSFDFCIATSQTRRPCGS